MSHRHLAFRYVVVVALLLGLVAGTTSQARAQGAACVVPHKLGVAFLLDDSGSMADNDPSDLRGVATGIGIDRMPDGAVAAAATFDFWHSSIFPPTVLTATNRAGLSAKVAASLHSLGGTEYASALRGALSTLNRMSADVDRKAIVFLSDGLPNDTYGTAKQAIVDAGIPIFTVGFGDADDAVLTDLAAPNGGQHYSVSSAGDAQAAFARIISTLACDTRQIAETVSLAPGETRSFPFAISPGDREFRSLASWNSGQVNVRLVRPDGSALTAADQRAGETFTGADTFVQTRAVNPAVGGWGLEITAPSSNIASVSVTVDVFKRTGADPPDAPRLATPADGATVSAGTTRLTFSPARGADRYTVLVNGQETGSAVGTATSIDVELSVGNNELRVLARNAFGATPSNPHTVTAISPEPVENAAFRFRPRLLFDSRERWRPLNIDRLLDEPGLRLCRFEDGTLCSALKGAGGLTSASGGNRYLKMPEVDGQPASPDAGCRKNGLLDCDSGAVSSMYYQATRRQGVLYLDYWYFLRHNALPLGVHQGDWEGVTASVFYGLNGPRLLDMAFSSHAANWRYLNLTLQRSDGDHVDVYVALDSHAAYPRPCVPKGGPDCTQTRSGHGWGRVGWGLYDGTYDGGAAWGNNSDAACIVAACLKRFPGASSVDADKPSAGGWAAWNGHWGIRGAVSVSGPPASPSAQKRFKEPWNSGESTRTNFGPEAARASRVVRCGSEWMGPGVIAAACDPSGLGAYARADATARFTLEGPGTADARPGIAQIVGDPLRVGQQLKLTGVAGTKTTLNARVEASDGVRETRITNLGLGKTGTVQLTIAGSKGNPTIRMRTPSGKTRTIKTPKATLARPLLVATRRGGRLTVTAQSTPRARVRIELRRGTRVLRAFTRTATRTGVVKVTSRTARVKTVRARVVRGKRTGAAVTVTPTRVR